MTAFVTVLAILGGGGVGEQEAPVLASRAVSPPASVQVESPFQRPAQLDVRNLSLARALTELRQSSGTPLAYSPSMIPSLDVSCDCREVSVADALDRMLGGTGLSFTAVHGQIVIQPPAIPAPPSIRSLSDRADFTVERVRRSGLRSVEARALVGTVVGRVVDARSMAPIGAAQVFLPGLNLGGLTQANGRFLIPNVPAGTHQIRVERLGYQASTAEVTVRDGESVEVNFSLTERALALDEIVVTGTAGGTQRRAIGNVVTSMNADEVQSRSPVVNVDQLLAQRTPGLMMMPGTGQVGTGSAVRIRGTSSITQGTDPIIYIDGVRMDSNPRRGPGQRGGANVSRLNDIHPSDIESIEIIKGPAAATLYGTEASNGVIQIITKRGATGTPQFDIAMRQGTNWLWNPEGRTGMRYMPDPNNPGQLIGLNVYANERDNHTGPIFGYGHLQSYNLNVRGGTDAVRYFASLSRDDDTGIVDWNWDRRIAVRGNMEILLTENLTVQLNSSYVTGQTRLAQGAIEIDPFSGLVWSNPRTLGTPSRGWRNAPPEEWRKVEQRADNDRSTTSVEVRYQPLTWTTHRLVAGLDNNAEVDWTLYPRMPEGASHFYGQNGLGNKSVSRGTRRFFTLDYSGSANFEWGNYSFQPSVGFQYYKSENSSITASGQQFPAIPITTIGGGAVRNGTEAFSENATVGVYFQQQVGWNNRAFVTAAIRADDNSAFGAEFDAAIYPKLSGTWVISEEDFWSFDFVEQLRLRGAWGAAGQQPGTFDAARLFSPAVGYQNQPALITASFGNPQLQPERGEELELGFDASFFGGRVDVEFTRYDRNVKDAIVNRPLPPSSGFSGSQVVNIGLIKSWGNELGVTFRILEGRRLRWELDSQLATMNNEIRSLGGTDVIFAGTQSQHREGYSIADLFMLKILDAQIDANGNVTSATCDGGTGPQGVDPGGAPVPCREAPQVRMGHSQPTWQVGVGNSMTLFDNLRLYARVEGNGGHYQVNTEIRATHNQATTEAVLLRNNPLIQAYRTLENDRTGLYEAGFLRLREVSASYDLPEMLLGRLGARRGSLTVGMRNVAMLWTAAHGWSTYRDGRVLEPLADMITWDPEVRSTGANAVGYQTVLPPTASLTASLRLSF